MAKNDERAGEALTAYFEEQTDVRLGIIGEILSEVMQEDGPITAEDQKILDDFEDARPQIACKSAKDLTHKVLAAK